MGWGTRDNLGTVFALQGSQIKSISLVGRGLTRTMARSIQSEIQPWAIPPLKLQRQSSMGLNAAWSEDRSIRESISLEELRGLAGCGLDLL